MDCKIGVGTGQGGQGIDSYKPARLRLTCHVASLIHPDCPTGLRFSGGPQPRRASLPRLRSCGPSAAGAGWASKCGPACMSGEARKHYPARDAAADGQRRVQTTTAKLPLQARGGRASNRPGEPNAGVMLAPTPTRSCAVPPRVATPDRPNTHATSMAWHTTDARAPREQHDDTEPGRARTPCSECSARYLPRQTTDPNRPMPSRARCKCSCRRDDAHSPRLPGGVVHHTCPLSQFTS